MAVSCQLIGPSVNASRPSLTLSILKYVIERQQGDSCFSVVSTGSVSLVTSIFPIPV